MAVCKRGGVWRVWYVCCNKTVYWAVVVRRRSQSFSLHGEHGGTHTVSTYTAVCPNGVLPGPSQGVLYNGSFWNAGPRTSSSRFPAPRFDLKMNVEEARAEAPPTRRCLGLGTLSHG